MAAKPNRILAYTSKNHTGPMNHKNTQRLLSVVQHTIALVHRLQRVAQHKLLPVERKSPLVEVRLPRVDWDRRWLWLPLEAEHWDLQ